MKAIIPCQVLLCLWLVLFHFSESIVFSIENPDTHRVVLPLEANVVIVCTASPAIVDPQIEIRHEGEDISEQVDEGYVTSEIAGGLRVTIPRVSMVHGGIYECFVSQVSGPRGIPAESANLKLNVQGGGGAFCFHDAGSLDFRVGDHFSLFCFYHWFASTEAVSPYDFRWGVEISGPGTRFITDSNNVTVEDGVKGMVRADIGPLQLSEQDTIYRCVHPRQIISGSKVCTVGPINVSPIEDGPASHSPTVPRTTSIRPAIQTAESISTWKGSSSNRMPSVVEDPTSPVTPDLNVDPKPTSSMSQEPDGSPLLMIILLASAAAISVIVLILILVCLVRSFGRREKRNSVVEKVPEGVFQEKPIEQEGMTDNPVYDGSDEVVNLEPKFFRGKERRDDGNGDTVSGNSQEEARYDGAGYLKPKSVWVAAGGESSSDDMLGNSEQPGTSVESRPYDNFRTIIGDVEQSYDRVNDSRRLTGGVARATWRQSRKYDEPPTGLASDIGDGANDTGKPTNPGVDIWDKYNTMRKSIVLGDDVGESVLY